ncbi:ATP-binding protein, partial [Streptomyces sp. NPDC004752]
REVSQGADGTAPATVQNAAVTHGSSAAHHEGAAAPGDRSPLIPRARTEMPPPAGRADDASSGARPLRRRVRGATLPTTTGVQPAVPQAMRPRDAQAERDALEEFEAAVARARLDSDTGSSARPGTGPERVDQPHDQNHYPEGAEQ